MKRVQVLFALLLTFAVLAADAQACGSHGGCGGGCGGGGFYGGGYGRGYYSNPYYSFPGIGNGQVAFRRGRRLARRSRRAAWFGFYGRSNRLAIRAGWAFNRGHRRRWF